MNGSYSHRGVQITYVIHAPTCSLIKVGTTDKPEQRFRQHSTSSPAPLLLLGLIPRAIVSEWELHRALQPYRHHGEWFRAEPAVRAYLKRCIESAAEQWFTSLDIPALDRVWELQILRERWDAAYQGYAHPVRRVSDEDLDLFAARERNQALSEGPRAGDGQS